MDEELRAEEGPQDPEHEPAEARADLDPPAEDPFGRPQGWDGAT